MKKLIFAFALIAILASSCTCPCANQRQIQSYRQYDNHTNEWVYWYLLMRPDNTYYYYHSSTPVSSFRNVKWSTSNDGFNQHQVQDRQYLYVESEDFSPELNKEFSTPENAAHNERPAYKYNESDDFLSTPSSSDKSYNYNQSDDFSSGSSGSSNDYNHSESSDFGGAGSSSGSSGGSYESNESNDFD